MNKLHSFYISKGWRELAYNLKIAAGGKCNRCGFIAVTKEDYKKLIGHHTLELTEENVDDVEISLNPEHIEVICHSCHNKEHYRFGTEKNVYIVYGSPLSGKSSFVREVKKPSDIVLDLDEIWAAVTLEDKYIKPNNLRFNIFKLRDELLDQVRTRYGEWHSAYVIGGYADRYERERLAEELGAELIYCNSSIEECKERAIEDNRPLAWLGYIDDWWEAYEE